MGLPTQPLTLTTGTLATLQARQSLLIRTRVDAAPASPTIGDAAPQEQAPPFAGRGRLVDIIA